MDHGGNAPEDDGLNRPAIFGPVLEAGNYLKTPKAFIYIRTHNNPKARAIKARHIHLILVSGRQEIQDKDDPPVLGASRTRSRRQWRDGSQVGVRTARCRP